MDTLLDVGRGRYRGFPPTPAHSGLQSSGRATYRPPLHSDGDIQTVTAPNIKPRVHQPVGYHPTRIHIIAIRMG